MAKIKKMPVIIMAIMVILSFANLFGLHISGAVIPIGVVFFFLNKIMEKESDKDCGLDFKSIGSILKVKKIWFWLLLPMVVDAVCVLFSVFFLPDYIDYETARAGGFVPVEISISSIALFFVFALGEEIAWRSFFQRQLNKAIPAIPVLFISSFLFSLGHYEQGNTVIVLYGLLFTFINSILYGVIFNKTKNAWVSTLSHFSANIFEVVIFVLMK